MLRPIAPLFAASLALSLSLLFACSSSPATGGTGGNASTSASTSTGTSANTSASASAGTGGQGTGGSPVDAGMDAEPDAAMCKLASKFSSSNAVCNACAEEKCCPEINGCLLDTACNDDYVNCSLACAFTDFDAGMDAGTEAGCLADCAQQYPKGKAEYDAAFGCADSACATECQ